MKLLTATTTATANKAVATRVAPTTLLIIVMTLIIGVLPSSFMSTTISVVHAQQQTTIEEEDANLLLNINPDRIMDISFGYWCSDAVFDCAIRSFATLGGELVMIDSGSSNLVFCGLPNPTRVFDVKRLVEDNNYLSQCATFANGNHGWYGPSYIGSIVALDDSDESTPIQNSVFSVMEKIVGMNGNSCGPIRSNSIGLELSSVRGIWGIGGVPGKGYNNFIYNDELDRTKWPVKGDRMVELLVGQDGGDGGGGVATCPDANTGCVCPQYQTDLPSTFNSALARTKSDKYAISWDGTFGKNTGKLMLGDSTRTNNTDDDALPKIELFQDGVDLGVLKSNVTRIEINGIDIPINITQYYFDTGAPKIYLPSQVYDAIQFDGGINLPNVTNITFFLPSITGLGSGETTIEMSTTQELMNDGTFAPDRQGSDTLIMGLNLMRYAQTIAFSFAPNPSPYMQIIPRTPHLLTPIEDISLSDNGVAGSLTNVSFDINAYKTPTITTSSAGSIYAPPTTTTTTTIMTIFTMTIFVAAVLCTDFVMI